MRKIILFLKWLLIPTSLIVLPKGAVDMVTEATLCVKLHFRPFKCKHCDREGISFPNYRKICQMLKCFLKEYGTS